MADRLSPPFRFAAINSDDAVARFAQLLPSGNSTRLALSISISIGAEARSLPREERQKLLGAIPEVELHHYLAELFQAMNPEYWVEVTHGVDEFGKDLVIVRPDPLGADVIAVVVKKGDIRGKTAGDVDELKERVQEVLTAKGERVTKEILSQIKQARDHDAVLASEVAKLRVTKVLVILVGEMSNNARERLEREVGGLGDVYGMSWLVDKFTEHYPQVFFEGRAIDFLDGLIQQLERDSFYAKTGRTLSECFVEPVVSQLDGQVAVDNASLAVQVRDRRIKFGDLMTFIGRRGRVLMIGDPGSGKSKAAAKMCIDAYLAAIRESTRRAHGGEVQSIPIMLSARSIQSCQSAEELLDKAIPLALRDRFKIGLLVVDGLDEVASSARMGLLKRVAACAQELDSSLLVTSRRVAAFSSAPSGFQRCEILPFEVGQALRLVQKLMLNADEYPALKNGLEQIQSQIPMNPLSLLLLVEVVSERKEVPSSITELYERFLDLVFGRWDHEKGVQVLFEYIIKRRVLARLAHNEFHVKGRLEIPKEDFDAFLESYASEFGWDAGELGDFLKEIERAGILEIHEEVYFRHRSFLDYFVAQYVHEQRADFDDLTGKLVDLYFDGVWTEVAFFYSGLSRDVSPAFLDALFAYQRGGDGVALDKLMVGRLLQAGWHSAAKVREEGVRRAVAQVEDVNAVLQGVVTRMEGRVPLVVGDLLTCIFVEESLGSVFVSKETASVLTEFEALENPSASDLKRHLALLWALRHNTDQARHQELVNAFVQKVQSAGLDSLTEARLLLTASLADRANKKLLKKLTRRLRQLSKHSPGELRKLLPVKGTNIPRPSGK